jgi:hypothetical protein
MHANSVGWKRATVVIRIGEIELESRPDGLA